MIWFTWRQFRIQTWVTVGALAALGVLLVITGRNIADAYAAANVAACGSDCTAAMGDFLRQVERGASGTVYNFAAPLVYVVPALIGIFWGAPLIARELEAGTHLLAWNQSVTRTRWLVTKLAIVGGAAAATAGLLSWAVTSWAHHIDRAAGSRMTPDLFVARGIAPIGYALFAFALGVTAGMLIRRTVPAMAVTLAGYTAAVLSMPMWVRAHLAPATHATPALDMSTLVALMIHEDDRMEIIGDGGPSDAWLLSNRTITPTGDVFTEPASPHCGRGAGVTECEAWVGSLGLRQDLVYQPADNFWPLQWTETGIFLAAAVLLAGFCFWWIRRRLI